jgi:hypothetical protein
MRDRTTRTIVLALAGLVVAYVIALFVMPIWPDFCDDSVAGSECDAERLQSMYGYVLIILGLATGLFGPIAGSLIHLLLNGAQWETPRGKESVITNIPLLVAVIYIGLGLLVLVRA